MAEISFGRASHAGSRGLITHNQLYPEICSFENLLLAAHRAEHGKRMQDTIGRFRTDLETELLQLRRELLTHTYTPGPYRETIITRPKRRMISAAPFRDRVGHHALCNVVMPLFERKMIFDLYSNRAGKGTHAAIRRAQQFCGQFDFVLKCDVRKFFPSMDHAVLKATIRQTLACRDTLWLLDKIVDGSNQPEPVCQVFPGDDLAEAAARRVGLPIGNLTSQWFGGVYLTAFDHWVKETLRCPGYVRYVDDFLLFADDKGRLAEWRAASVGRLLEQRLNLNERKSRSYPTSDGVTFLGQRIWPGRRRLCRQNVADARRRLRWNVRRYQGSSSQQRRAAVPLEQLAGSCEAGRLRTIDRKNQTGIEGHFRCDRNAGNRVLRGGNWTNNANNARCAYRNNNNPDNANNNIGFRCVRGIWEGAGGNTCPL